MSIAAEARRYLRAHQVGVLATHSNSSPGYPFGSVVPYVLDHAARPMLLVSGLAEHTRNLERDARASLIVHDFSAADQAGPRLTVVGDAERFDDAAMAARYVRYLPEAERFMSFGDFTFWRLVPREALFIRGFGRIEWVQADALTPPADRMADFEEDILTHMNADHTDALALYCRHAYGVEAAAASMVGIDCEGFDVRADGRVLRFTFDAPVTDAGDARQALAALAHAARDV